MNRWIEYPMGREWATQSNFWDKFPSQYEIDKWNREVDENGGVHPSLDTRNNMNIDHSYSQTYTAHEDIKDET